MKEGGILIRSVEATDNEVLATVIYSILDELEVPKKGSTYEDEELKRMFESFSVSRSHYFVVEVDGKVVGGGGIMPLKNGSADTCELQKMYLLKETRGMGIGSNLIEVCLQKAREFDFSYCYLETLTSMKAAQQLYIKSGFTYLKERMGDTGHCVCPVWMIKEL